jgi:peptide-methionine (S)-S-oxide reductase
MIGFPHSVYRVLVNLAFLVMTFGAGTAFGQMAKLPATPPGAAVATFAGGCLWCMEAPFDKLDGVLATTSGYIGGMKTNPTYEEVSSGGSGHAEAVQVLYDPKKVTYEKLLDVYWHNVDPTVTDRQFCDVGSQYRPAYSSIRRAGAAAEASKAALDKSKPFKEPIVTPIVTATEFWPAEEYHQNYYLKNPVRYTYYRTGCGRDARLKQLWGASTH